MTGKLAILALGAASLAAPALLAHGSGGQQQPPPAQNPPGAQPQAAPGQQPATPPAAQPEEGAPLSKLGLSDDQKKQIHKIRKQAEEQVQAIKKDTSLNEQQQTIQIRQVRRNQVQQVDEVLTPEQREKYDAWRKSHARHRRPQPQQQPARPDGA